MKNLKLILPLILFAGLLAAHTVNLSWTNPTYSDWAASTSYAAGAYIMPTSGNPGNYVFFAQEASGPQTSGASEPTWPQTSGSDTSTDGGITDWQNTGIVGTLAYNNIYRAPASAPGSYSLIYTSSTPVTSYTDTAPGQWANNYVVTAVNTVSAESGYSGDAIAMLEPPGDRIIGSGHKLRHGIGFLSGGGVPLTYNARYDNCVTGSESGCTGATSGAGSPMQFYLTSTGSGSTVPFSEQAPAGSMAYDPDFGSTLVMATDQTTLNTGTPYTALWNMGSDGGHDAFSPDEKLMLANNSGGGEVLLWVRPDLIHAKLCVTSPSANCVGPTGIYTSQTPDSTHLSANGLSFSRVASETNILYEQSTSALQVNKVTVCRFVTDPGCSGQTSFPILVRSTAVDFTSNSPVTCSVLPGSIGNGTAYTTTWQGSFQVANDGTMSYALGGGIDWAASWAPTVTQSFIVPQSTNANRPTISNAVWSGGSVTLTLNRSLAASGYTLHVSGLVPSAYNGDFTSTAIGTNTVTYALATNPGVCTDCSGFLGYNNAAFQATTVTGSTGILANEPDWQTYCESIGSTCADAGVVWTAIGTVGGQGPGFDIVAYRPSQGCQHINTRTGMAWSSIGNPVSGGQLQTDDIITCTAYANGGTVPSTCPFRDRATIHEVEQEQNGKYFIFGPTGGEAVVAAGTFGDGYAVCQSSSDTWIGAYNPATTYANNNVVSYGGLFYESQKNSNTGNTPPTGLDSSTTWWNQTESLCNAYMYDMSTGMMRACDDYNGCTGHGISGNSHKWFGKFYDSVFFGEPAINGIANPGTKLIPSSTAGLPCDDHGTAREQNSTDTALAFTSTVNVPSWPTRYTSGCNAGPGGAASGCALYDEFIGMKTDGSGLTYRFAHNFNDASEANFSADNAIAVVGPLGDLAAVSTDMMCTRGNITAASTSGKSGGYIRGMLLQEPNISLYVSDPGQGGVPDTVYPVTSNSGDYVYQTTTSGTASNSATPTGGWCQTVGCSVTWGTAVLQNIGSSNCRSDVMLVDLLSAHQ